MQKHFYHSLVTIEPVHTLLVDLDLSDAEKQELIIIAEENLHYTILDVVLSELSSDDKRVFFLHVTHGDHDRVWTFLHEKTEHIEEKILKAAEDFFTLLAEDVKESKEKNKK